MGNTTGDQVKIYMLYALLHPVEEYCYLGKTSSRRLSAAYSDHICQRIEATSGYFDKYEERPKLHLLNTVEGSRSVAYKHLVAWTRIFMDAGYVPLNYDGTIRHAQTLKPDTQAIVDQIRQEPLEAILKRTYLEKPSNGDRPPEKKEDAGPLIQINLRIPKGDKKRFAQYCTDHGMTQREGFSLLLDGLHSSGEARYMRLLEELRQKNQRLQEENKKLKKKMAVMTGAELPERVQKAMALLPIQKEGIEQYLEQLLPPELPGAPLKRGTYRGYMKHLSPEECYVYPEEEGILILHLEAILWGNALHRACFLIGTGESGARFKLRYYPKTTYTGIGLDDTRYARQNARWLVGAQKAKDGAMELIMALPLPEETAEAAERPVLPKPLERKPSLDDQIRRIEMQK